MAGIVRRLTGALDTWTRARRLWAPQRAKIAVLHATNASALAPLFGAERYEIVDLEGGVLYVHPRILLSTVGHTIRIRRLTVGYALAVLGWIRPSIVVTFIDNSAVFQIAARRFRAARFLAIQNGARLLDRDHPVGRSPQIHLREFACLGRHEIDQYNRHGARVGTYYAIGSLMDSYYRAGRMHGVPAVKAFDLCLPSQFKSGAQSRFSERLDAFAVLAGHVKRFCESHGTTLCVPLRKHPETDRAAYEWERQYLERLLGTHAQIFPNVPGAYTTYELVDRSRVSIGMHTTVLREGFGRGNRVLSCNYSGDPVYTFPLPGPWTLTDPSYDLFEERLSWLLNASDEEYAQVCGDLPSYLISYDEKMPTHLFLQRLIADAVGGAPEPTSSREPQVQRAS